MEEERINRDQLTIPEHCTKGTEWGEGFGKHEFAKTLIFTGVGFLIGGVLCIWLPSLTTVILAGVMGSACGYIFCKKDRYSRQSLFDMLVDLKRYMSSQKYFEFRRCK